MKILTKRLRSIISGNSDSSPPKALRLFDCIKTRKGIVRELMISKESRNLVGLISPVLGEGIFLIMVLSLEWENRDEIVVFQRYEITEGRFHVTGRLTINEIKGVCPFVHNYQAQVSDLRPL